MRTLISRLPRILLISVAASLLVPGLAAMEGDNTGPKPSSSPRPSFSPEAHRLSDAQARVKVEGTQFCSRFTDATGTVSSETDDRFAKLSNNFAARGQKVDGEFGDLAQRIAKNRADADAKLAAKLAELDAKATTSAQKTAVAEFKASLLAARTARRAAVDAADAAFKAGVQQAVAARQGQLRTAAAAYKTAVAKALAAARASCAAHADPQTVRANLKTALDAARANLEAARKSADKVGPNLDTLKATRKAAVAKANADFKTAVQAALAKLRAALGSSASPSPTATP